VTTVPRQADWVNWPKALVLVALLCIIVLHTLTMGPTQFMGAQGWAYVLGGSTVAGDRNLLTDIGNNLKHTPTSETTTQPAQRMTPQQYIDLITQRMTLDQKIGQLMLVQFVGPAYSNDLNIMINQYGVGTVLIFTANGNIVDKGQLTNLIQQMQSKSSIPLAVAIDQEGGTVDRLKNLDGPRPAAAVIGATNDLSKAMEAGRQDAQDLSTYGINLNLAPVVDVTNVYNAQMYDRTFGHSSDVVTQMASAYLKGVQQSGKVIGTLKHFPGLGDVVSDPHITVPYLTRSRSDLERTDWAPYRTLIKQGNVHAIMVTHEIVTAIDNTMPSSLSYKLVTGILRQELGFQGVIMTDSLTMQALTAYYAPSQAAALAIEAGADLLMGASTPSGVAAMIEGIKQAMNSGAISQQRIDESVRRILMMKYEMGLLPIPQN
jgi:beta-N-acetylhexosaminidase